MSATILTIAQQKGGAGKTTLCAHMAVAALLSRSPNLRVALLDLDPQGSLGEWFEARELNLGADQTGLSFRTASGWGARREANALARDHDMVVIDTPPKSDRETQPAIEMASLVLIPMQPSPVDLWATKQTLQMAEKDKTPALIVINRVPSRAALTQDVLDMLKEEHTATAPAMLGNRTAYAAAIGQGSTVMEMGPSAQKAADEVLSLYQAIQNNLPQNV